MNWLLPGVRTAYLFFPLWLGYILTADALVLARTGSSIWRRSPRHFVLLFAASAPVWWLFELINWRTKNWEYLGNDQFTVVEYYLLCTICFSTVMPAVFETAELVSSFRWIERLATGPRLFAGKRIEAGSFMIGIAMLTLTLAWPRYFYPFVWTSLALILDPTNRWLGKASFLETLREGDWRLIVCLSLGALICGFFWEMWNFWSYPKWVYHTPGADFLHVFEMPLLGYGGYVPFALELYAMKNLLAPRIQTPI